MSQILSLRLLLALLRLACAVAFTTTVDFETNDCGKQFTVQTYDQYRVKAAPLANPAGGADHCKVQFISEEPFRIYIQDFHTNDCTVTLKFYENDPSETREKYQLGCPPHEPPSSRVWTTDSGRLIVRLDKSSGTTTSYQFELVISTGSNDLSATAGGGAITTGAIIGIIVGVIAFLIIIVALVLYFVCKQMREKKEERMRQMEAQSPPVFTTVTSQNYDARYRSETDRNNGTWSRRERERERERERHEREVEQAKLPEPKVNGILKNSPGRRRRRRDDTGGGGYDNDGYTPSVSSTEEGSEFDYETYRRGIEQGLPSGTAKNFSLNPDPPKDRRERRERMRQDRESRNEYRSDFRSASQTSDSSADEDGYINPAFTDDRGNTRRSASLGKVSGRGASKYAESESSRRSADDSASAFTRSTTGSYRSRTRSYSPSRTDGSRDSSDTGTSITTGSGSRFQRNPNDASIRRSRSRSQSRSSKGSVPRRKHHQHDPAQAQAHGHQQHHHRSRSRDRKKDAYLPVFADAKKLQKMQKK